MRGAASHMKTIFTDQQRQDPKIRDSEKIIRTCVHCGFCTATCPTYQILGDELDSPRGRIYLIREMLQNNRPPDAKTVLHIDRCLSCLSCVTTCPSGVDYKQLIDHAREHIELTYRRPVADRTLRAVLAFVLPRPAVLRLAIRAAWMVRPLRRAVPIKLRSMVDFAPQSLPAASPRDLPQVFPAVGERKFRVALLTGCVQKVLDTSINDATISLLTRHGCEVVVAKGAGCCGALSLHMGRSSESRAAAEKNVEAWFAEIEARGLDAIVVNTSGCGTVIKDYGHIFRDTKMAAKALSVAKITKDFTEFASQLDLSIAASSKIRVAYHSACSLQHGQQVRHEPVDLLTKAGFDVVEPVNAHLCCGSAGTYNLLQPEISGELRRRKVATLVAVTPQVIAAGNIGCMMQIAAGTELPVVHTVELLDWATGGKRPDKLRDVAI